VPKSHPVRGCFRPAKGRYLVEADYSQIELRVAALLTQDARMLALLRAGVDLHQATADAIGCDRALAKTINFGVFYGMGPAHLAEVSGLNVREAKGYITSWYDTYPRVRAWQEDQAKRLTDLGYVESLFGRRRWLDVAAEEEVGAYRAVLRQAANHPVQSSAAELTLLATTALSQDLGTLGKVVATVHDSVIVEADRAEVHAVGVMMKGTMEDATGLARRFGFKVQVDVPTPVGISVGKDWSNMKGVT
jgi:DNA polymerase-1